MDRLRYYDGNVKTPYAVLCLTVGLLLLAIFGSDEPVINPLTLFGGVLILLAVVAFVARIVKNTAEAPPPGQQFTTEQLAAMNGLVSEKLRSLDEQRQVIIDKGAREGKTVSTEAVLRSLEASKAAHQGADREGYAASVDQLALEFREKYPNGIPVDEAFRLMKEWE